MHVRDYVQIFVTLQNEKRGSWCDKKPARAYSPESRIVTVPVAYVWKRHAAIEDTRLAVCDKELASEIQRAIDKLLVDFDTQVEHMKDLGDEEGYELPAKSKPRRVTFQINSDDDEDISNPESLTLVPNVESIGTQYLVTYTPVEQSPFDPDHPKSESDNSASTEHRNGNEVGPQDDATNIKITRALTQTPAPSIHPMETRGRSAAPYS